MQPIRLTNIHPWKTNTRAPLQWHTTTQATMVPVVFKPSCNNSHATSHYNKLLQIHAQLTACLRQLPKMPRSRNILNVAKSPLTLKETLLSGKITKNSGEDRFRIGFTLSPSQSDSLPPNADLLQVIFDVLMAAHYDTTKEAIVWAASLSQSSICL